MSDYTFLKPDETTYKFLGTIVVNGYRADLFDEGMVYRAYFYLPGSCVKCSGQALLKENVTVEEAIEFFSKMSDYDISAYEEIFFSVDNVVEGYKDTKLTKKK